jgi:succinate dehydrogenase / fumarate reductase membrane anchor subunit
MNPNQAKPAENTWLWLLKVLAGLFIIALLEIHFVVNHLVAPGGLLSYADVINYYQNPIVPIMEGFFLVFVVGHALLGLRSIILDLNPSTSRMRWIDFILFALGAIAVLYGIWLLIILVLKGNA